MELQASLILGKCDNESVQSLCSVDDLVKVMGFLKEEENVFNGCRLSYSLLDEAPSFLSS